VAIYLDGSDEPDRAADGSPLLDDDFLVLVNAWWQPLDFTIPATRAQTTWQTAIDTYDPDRPPATPSLHPGDQLTVDPRSIVVLRSPISANSAT
jgi:glycogen operon protein